MTAYLLGLVTLPALYVLALACIFIQTLIEGAARRHGWFAHFGGVGDTYTDWNSTRVLRGGLGFHWGTYTTTAGWRSWFVALGRRNGWLGFTVGHKVAEARHDD